MNIYTILSLINVVGILIAGFCMWAVTNTSYFKNTTDLQKIFYILFLSLLGFDLMNQIYVLAKGSTSHWSVKMFGTGFWILAIIFCRIIKKKKVVTLKRK